MSQDPLTASYPWYTPYQFAGNSPIQSIDLDGLEEYHYTLELVDTKWTLNFSHTSDTYGIDTKPGFFGWWSTGDKIPEGEKYYIVNFTDSYWGEISWQFDSEKDMKKASTSGPSGMGAHREMKREATLNSIDSFSQTMTSMPATSPSYHKGAKKAPNAAQKKSTDKSNDVKVQGQQKQKTGEAKTKVNSSEKALVTPPTKKEIAETFIKQNLRKTGLEAQGVLNTIEFKKDVKKVELKPGSKVWRFVSPGQENAPNQHFFTDAYGADAGPNGVGFTIGNKILIEYMVTTPTTVLETKIKGTNQTQFISSELQNNIIEIGRE